MLHRATPSYVRPPTSSFCMDLSPDCTMKPSNCMRIRWKKTSPKTIWQNQKKKLLEDGYLKAVLGLKFYDFDDFDTFFNSKLYFFNLIHCTHYVSLVLLKWELINACAGTAGGGYGRGEGRGWKKGRAQPVSRQHGAQCRAMGIKGHESESDV